MKIRNPNILFWFIDKHLKYYAKITYAYAALVNVQVICAVRFFKLIHVNGNTLTAPITDARVTILKNKFALK